MGVVSYTFIFIYTDISSDSIDSENKESALVNGLCIQIHCFFLDSVYLCIVVRRADFFFSCNADCHDYSTWLQSP